MEFRSVLSSRFSVGIFSLLTVLTAGTAGYSDYFCDLSDALKDEIIARTEQTEM